MIDVVQFFQSTFKQGSNLIPVRSLDEIKVGDGIILDYDCAFHAKIRTSRIEVEATDAVKLYGMVSISQKYDPKTHEPIGDSMGLNLPIFITKELIDQGNVYRVVYQ